VSQEKNRILFIFLTASKYDNFPSFIKTSIFCLVNYSRAQFLALNLLPFC
jgi:hypothetical protein